MKINQAMISAIIMRGSQVLLATAVLLFLGFLASPTFVDSVAADGTVMSMLPGWAAVLAGVVFLPSAAVHFQHGAVLLVFSCSRSLRFLSCQCWSGGDVFVRGFCVCFLVLLLLPVLFRWPN